MLAACLSAPSSHFKTDDRGSSIANPVSRGHGPRAHPWLLRDTMSKTSGASKVKCSPQEWATLTTSDPQVTLMLVDRCDASRVI